MYCFKICTIICQKFENNNKMALSSKHGLIKCIRNLSEKNKSFFKNFKKQFRRG